MRIARARHRLARLGRRMPDKRCSGVCDGRRALHRRSVMRHCRRNTHASLSEATSFLSFISKTDKYAKQVTKPVLVIQGLNDHLVSPRAVAKLFSDIPSASKTFMIDGKGEHLVLEEGRFSPPVTEKLISWMKTGATSQSSQGVTEFTVNAQALSPSETRRLTRLQRLSQSD